jgi:hypothetical protein
VSEKVGDLSGRSRTADRCRTHVRDYRSISLATTVFSHYVTTRYLAASEIYTYDELKAAHSTRSSSTARTSPSALPTRAVALLDACIRAPTTTRSTSGSRQPATYGTLCSGGQSCQPDIVHLFICISTIQNGLTVVSLPMNMPCPVPSLVKRMPSPPATTVQPWMW